LDFSQWLVWVKGNLLVGPKQNQKRLDFWGKRGFNQAGPFSRFLEFLDLGYSIPDFLWIFHSNHFDLPFKLPRLSIFHYHFGFTTFFKGQILWFLP